MLTPNVVPDFTAIKVAVVGDLIADHSLHARPTRLSREAPVMILRHEKEEIGAGGAANVARNLWALGATTYLCGAVGRDTSGRELLRILESEQVEVSGVEAVAGWVTPTKTRILGAAPGRTPHQMLRIDREPDLVIEPRIRKRVADSLRALAGRVDAVLVSDYGYGLVEDEVADAAREVMQAGATAVLDPRSNFEPFRGFSAFKPNLAELAAAIRRHPDALADQDELVRAAAAFLERFGPEQLLVTLGSGGMAFFSDEHPQGVFIKAAGPDQVVDVTGAGDTAVAAFTLSLAAGLEGPRAMRLANAASGVVVMENGAAVCNLSKLRSDLPQAPQPQVAGVLGATGAAQLTP